MRMLTAGIGLALCGGLLMVTPPETCAAPSASIEGAWGGDRLQLTIDATGLGRVELDCASGTIAGPLKVSDEGRFTASGKLEQYRNGAQAADEAAASSKAMYEGEIKGEQMTLSILREGAAKPQVFQLRKGARVKLVRCL